MCEIVKRDGNKCTQPSRFHVHIRTMPQMLGPDGAYGMESSPAGRSNTVCHSHLSRVVTDLLALPIRYGSALPTVTTFRSRAE